MHFKRQRCSRWHINRTTNKHPAVLADDPLGKSVVDVANNSLKTKSRHTKTFGRGTTHYIISHLEFLILLAVERDSLLARLGIHGVLVDVVLADVDVGLPLELADLDPLVLAQMPGWLVTLSRSLS